MLRGFVLDKRINKTFGVKGVATIQKLDLFFHSNEFSKSIGFEGYRAWFDGPEYKEYNGTDFRRLVLNLDANKYKTNFLNYTLATELSAIIKYCVEKSKVLKRVDTNGIGTLTKELKGVGTCVFEQGSLVALDINTPYFKISLDECFCNDEELAVFRQFKAKDNFGNILSPTPVKNKGYKIDSEVLGIEVELQSQKGVSASAVGVELSSLYTDLEEVFAAHPDKNFAWIKDQKYIVVTPETLDNVIQEFWGYDDVIAFDTETTGLKITFRSRLGLDDQLAGVVLSKEVGTGYYFPLRHNKIENLCSGDDAYFMEKYMRRILEKKPIITHNASFDWKVAYIYGINTNIIFDTMYAVQITLCSEYAGYSSKLKLLCKEIFGLDQLDLNNFVDNGWGVGTVTFADLPYEFVEAYAPTDGDITLRLYQWLKDNKIIEKYNAARVLDLEIGFGKAVGYSEFYGYHVAVESIPALREKTKEGLKRSYAKMTDIIGKRILDEIQVKNGSSFNPNSSQQLGEIMYDKLGYPSKVNRTTNKEYLKELADQENLDGTPRYPLCKYILEYRIFENLDKNFLVRLDEEECRKANAKSKSKKKKTVVMTDDGFIFPGVNSMGAATGRVSVKEPNYQSYNDVVKKYITPRKDYVMVDSDFSQIEQRVLASMAQETLLMEAMGDPDMDYHQYQAARMFSVVYAAVTKALRQQSKGINFGLPYGMGDMTLGARIFGARTKENEKKAAKLRKLFFEGQERIERFFKVVRDEGVAKGYTETYIGRRRYYRADKFSEASIRRQAGNAVIQGSAADIYKEAVVRLFNRIVKKGWLGLVLFDAFVHDELLMEVHKSIDMNEFVKVWREEYQLEIEGFCKLYAGFGVGTCWYNAKKEDLPPQYIDKLVADYEVGRTPKWDEDHQEYIKRLYDEYEQFNRDRLAEFITDTGNEGTILKPAMNVLLRDFLFEDIENTDIVTDGALGGLLDSVGYILDDKVDRSELKKQLNDTVKNIKLYRGLHGLSQDVEFINMESSAEKDTGSLEIESDNGTDNEVDLELLRELKRNESIGRTGYYFDSEAGEVIISEECIPKVVRVCGKQGSITRTSEGAQAEQGYVLCMLNTDGEVLKSQYRVQDLKGVINTVGIVRKAV